MNTITISTFKFSELTEDIQEKVIERERSKREEYGDIPWLEETVDSLKALINAIHGITLKDWNIGAYNQNNYIRIDFDEDATGELTGKRAFAWLENNLLSYLRIPWYGKERWKLSKYGSYYRAGMVKPCPFTGYCFDEDLLDLLKKALLQGDTVKDALLGLADETRFMLEKEAEYYMSEEAIKEDLENNGENYTEDGHNCYSL